MGCKHFPLLLDFVGGNTAKHFSAKTNVTYMNKELAELIPATSAVYVQVNYGNGTICI